VNLGHHYSFDAAYRRLIKEVQLRGHECRPRGKRCVEVRPADFSISSPAEGLYTGASRKLNYRFLAVETLQYIAGHGWKEEHARLLASTNKNVSQFMEGGLFRGAYGPRLSKSIPEVVNSLANDPDTRQAVASIWKPGEDIETVDVPCTLSLQFLRVKDRLDMVTTMRSNDLNWGTPYDVAAFSAIQLAVCSCLSVKPGAYHHRVGSLHVYLDSPPVVAEVDEERFMTSSGLGWPPFSDRTAREPVAAWSRIEQVAGATLDALHSYRDGGMKWSEIPEQEDRDVESFMRMIRGKDEPGA